VSVGDAVRVSGTVTEFRPGGSATDNLTTTEITSPSVTVVSATDPLPAPAVIGSGGRQPPDQVIEDDAAGSVETSGVFDPAQDGIDFYESLEGMRARVNDAVTVGPRNAFGEIPVLGDDGAAAGIVTVRGGIVVRPEDFNPERIQLDDTLMPTPVVNVGDGFTTPVVGILDYSFGNFKLNITAPLSRVDGGLQREVTRVPIDQEIAVGTYNVENLDPGDGLSFARHADLIVNHLQSPDLLAIEEVQDNDGAANSSVTDASVTWSMLIGAIEAAGGPEYEYRQIDPIDDADGGQPGGNIRVGFLFRTDRGLQFIDRPGGGPTSPTTVVNHPSGPRLSSSPGRVDPLNPAFFETRRSLAGEFRMHGRKVFVIANHFSSKGDDDPLFGRWQPPVRFSEVARHGQAQAVNDFVDEILVADPQANVIVLGDINDFEFSETVDILEGGVITSLMDTLPKPERYSYVFEGNSQVLDQILVSDNLLGNFPIEYDPVHVNSEFADQASDHDPQVARLDLRGRPALK
jgi:predicted extracellular nuclease